MKKKVVSIIALGSILLACNNKEKTLFNLLPSEKTGIDFINKISETESFNIINTEFVYNGGGVAAGDLNGDGLQDLVFTGNQVDNKIYLNRGNQAGESLKFEDISKVSNVIKKHGEWSSGVNLIDINQDKKLDIYICNTLYADSTKRRNLLYINQGNNANQVPIFKEMGHEYGVDSDTHSSNAQFFDYDNDGDLDLFIATNVIENEYPNTYREKVSDGTSWNRDRLLKNEWNEQLKHPVFRDVSLEANLKLQGFSHSSLISDFNNDGWLDIYVANDYVSNDLMYINNHDGTFTNKIAEIFKHQANSAMGSDLGDINNDGKMDLFTTEMMPYTNKRKKLFLSGNNYITYQNNELYHFEYQVMRNTLQLNQGTNPETGLPIYSDISLLANTYETEWSWTPLFADFDNDGFKDCYVTNGFPRDITDHDFAVFRSKSSNLVSALELQSMIPQVKVPNFAFRNSGNLNFTDETKNWGLDIPSFSNGAIYADLDNDGDLDIVVNNINDKAFVFENTLNNDKKEVKNNFVRFELQGIDKNPTAINAKIDIFYEGKRQTAELLAARGYLSASERIAHFGIGKSTKIDSVVIDWRNGYQTTLQKVEINKTHSIKYNPRKVFNILSKPAVIFVAENAANLGLNYVNQENDFIDFNNQKTIPHKFSQYTPPMAVGDLNNDGLDDIFFGGSSQMPDEIYYQQKNGKFTGKKYPQFKNSVEKKEENSSILIFDAENDGDNDVYLGRGSSQFDVGSPLYQDILLLNDGKGNLKPDSVSLPKMFSNTSIVKAADMDNDGDLDLFVGSRVLPKFYPKADRSYILRNDSKPNQPKFTDVTKQICPDLVYAGLISDALWTDFNNDNKIDLVLAGEWMPLSFFQNMGNKMQNITSKTDIADKIGWWNSLAGGDFDNDGDTDYIAGNFGLNTYFKCSSNEPIRIYAKDFDKNGTYEAFISCYWKDSTGTKNEYFYHTFDDMNKQTPLIRNKFDTYGQFGSTQVKDVFTKQELEGTQILATNYMQSVFVENLGNGKFAISPLPIEAQFAPIYGILPYDYDQDGQMDVLLTGNDYGMELMQGRADAFYGLVLHNKGKHNFEAVSLNNSNFFVPKEGRGIAKLNVGEKELLIASQNRDAVKVFSTKNKIASKIALTKDETYALVSYKNGKKQRVEFYWGSGFLSQESRNFTTNLSMNLVTFFDKNGKKRDVKILDK